MLPIMLCNEIGNSYEFIDIDKAKTSDQYIWHYNSTIAPKFFLRPGHDPAMKWDSKIYQYETLFDLVNVPDYEVWQTSLGLIKNIRNTKQKYKEFLITTEFGEGGKSFMYCNEDTHPEEIFKRFKTNKIRVSDYIPNAECFSLHCIIANETSFYVSPIVKQHITDKVIYSGGRYPCEIPHDPSEMCETICKAMYADGYIGMFHLDFMIANEELYFCEINPRMAASTPFMACTLEIERDIILSYIEYRAILTGGIPPENITRKSLQWDFKIFDGNIPDKTIEISHREIRDQFKIPGNGPHYVDLFDGRYMEVRVDDN